jgi:hypothetical protein
MKLVWLCLWAAISTTSPATMPDAQLGGTAPANQPTNDIVTLTSKAAQADKVVAAASSSAESRTAALPAYQAAKQALVDAQKNLDAARAGNDIQARLDASSAFNHAKAALKSIHDASISSDPTLSEAVKVQADLHATLAKAEKEEADRQTAAEAAAAKQKADADEAAIRADPIKLAIREKRAIPGMTLDQVRQALGAPGKLVSEDARSQVYEWQTFVSYQVPQGGEDGGAPVMVPRVSAGPITTITFVNGKADTIDHSSP